jgi:hypothetical protein
MGQDELDGFVYSLIDRKNLKGMTPESREIVAGVLKELVTEQINRAVLDALPEDKLDQIDQLTSQENFNPADVQKIIDESGINVAQITTDTLLYFESFYLGNGETTDEQ